jgi:hypothetical protein
MIDYWVAEEFTRDQTGRVADFVNGHNRAVWNEKALPHLAECNVFSFPKDTVVFYDKTSEQGAYHPGITAEYDGLDYCVYVPYGIAQGGAYDYPVTLKEHSAFTITSGALLILLRYPQVRPDGSLINLGEEIVVSIIRNSVERGLNVTRDKNILGEKRQRMCDRDDLLVDGKKFCGYDTLFCKDDPEGWADFSLALNTDFDESQLKLCLPILQKDPHFVKSTGSKKGIGFLPIPKADIVGWIDDVISKEVELWRRNGWNLSLKY